MGDNTSEETNNNFTPVSNAEGAIRHFHNCLALGKHWYIALLETIGLWTDESEICGGKTYLYLIGGEAFDWLLLAERLCETVDGKIPEKEKFDLLFCGQPPLRISQEEFQNLIGASKYHQLLNFFYGVTVEQALVQAVREEVRKERHSSGLRYRQDEENEAYSRIYGESEIVLIKQFRKEKHHALNTGSNLTEMKEFAYWCFKYRLQICEKAKVASDTQKALHWLKRYGIFSN
jgi:hypothetical protein